MKKSIIISLLFLFVFTNTEAHQLLKLHLLFHHFIDHKQTEKDISLINFIKKHYGSESSKTHDHNNEHEKLPFKSSDCHVAHNSITPFVLFNFTFQFQIPNSSIINSSYLENFPPSIIIPIWQPPKLA